MKKLILLLSLFMAFLHFTNAQTIEVIGIGVANQDLQTLHFTNPEEIDSVVVEAIGILTNEDGKQVQFFEPSGDEDYTVNFKFTEKNYSIHAVNGDPYSFGYYTATFDDVDTEGITLDQMTHLGDIKSFIAYIYRPEDPSIFSTIINEHAIVYLNGSTDPYVVNIPIPETPQPRNIEITIPFSDLASHQLRWAHVTASAGDVKVVSEFQLNNEGEYLRLENILLPNVAGNVTNVELVIYSPIEATDNLIGDSFITGMIALSTEEEEIDGCTFTQGYWKTHSSYGPASEDLTWELIGPDSPFFKSGMTYYEAINTPSKSKYFILASQYIAAELNMLNGASDLIAAQVFAEATVLLNTYSLAYFNSLSKKEAKSLSKEYVRMGNILDDFNQGIIGPGHCDEVENLNKSAEIAPENEIQPITNMMLFPNPAKNHTTISFTPTYDGFVQINLYNSLGQKVNHVFNQYVIKDISMNVPINCETYKSGLYFLSIQDKKETEIFKFKIVK